MPQRDSQMKATIIAEDFAGMRSQGRGLAERAGFLWDFQPVIIKKRDIFSHLPVRFWPYSLDRFQPFHISPNTRLIISMGGRGAVAGAALGRHYGLPVVQVQAPRAALSPYALVIAGQHDRLKGRNVFTIRTALHDVTLQRLQKAAERWGDVIRAGSERVLGVLLGGSNGRYTFGPKEALNLSERLAAYLRMTNMRCVITPSRRSSAEAVQILRQKLAPLGGVVMEGDGEENPYLGILACADVLAVTQDSVSMVSEAVATDKAVCILPLTGHSKRISHFIRDLAEMGRITTSLEEVIPSRYECLDDTSLAAEELHRRIQFDEI